MDRVTLRYVTEFRCLAGDCKEVCCSGLRVELSAANHATLVTRAAGTPIEDTADRLIVLEAPAARTVRNHAYIDAGGMWCPFLDDDWLCAIHRDLGEAALPDPCSLFPRVLTELHGRRELAATLACPETARLCLTTPDAVALVPFAEGAMAREIVVRRLADAPTDPYVALIDDVRQICLDVMAADGIRAPVRVLLLADLAARIDPFFHAGSTAFDIARLRAELARIPERVPAIVALFERTPVASLRAVAALKNLLLARLPHANNERYDELIRPLVLRDVEAGNDAIKAALDAATTGGLSVGADDAVLRDRVAHVHARISPAFDAQLDEYLRRYTINAIIKDWYTAQPTLGAWLTRVVVRLALSQVATLTHPGLDVVTADRLADAAVEAFQIIAKNIEHVPAFMDLCERYVHERGLADLAGLALLLRV